MISRNVIRHFSLLRNLLTGKGKIRPGEGAIRAVQDF